MYNRNFLRSNILYREFFNRLVHVIRADTCLINRGMCHFLNIYIQNPFLIFFEKNIRLI